MTTDPEDMAEVLAAALADGLANGIIDAKLRSADARYREARG